jgi:hypothetical protein
VQLLVSFEIVEPGESLAAFRTLMWPLTTMAHLVIFAMEVARKSLSADGASVVSFLALSSCRIEGLREIAHFRMECAGMLLEIFRVYEADVCAQAVRDFTLEGSVVDVDMSLANLLVFESFGKVSASYPLALVSPFFVVKCVVCGLLVRARLRLGEFFEQFAVAFQRFGKALYADHMSCVKPLLLEGVDMAGELHKAVVELVFFEHTAFAFAIFDYTACPIFSVVSGHEIIYSNRDALEMSWLIGCLF